MRQCAFDIETDKKGTALIRAGWAVIEDGVAEPTLGTCMPHEVGDLVEQIAAADVIFEVVAASEGTPLTRVSREQHKRLITGEEVFALQAVEQFVLYTGIRPDTELFARAAAHARGQSVR